MPTNGVTITDFTHIRRQYVPDKTGGTWNVSMRNVYLAASGMPVAAGGASLFPSKHARRRYIHFIPTAGGFNALTRHYPTISANNVTACNADGVNWTLKGYRGETDRP